MIVYDGNDDWYRKVYSGKGLDLEGVDMTIKFHRC